MSENHILVIDDDDRLRVLLRRFLEESGFRVTDAGSASDARKILGAIAFDLLVIDIMMPGETGLELLADVRKHNNVPALFLTAMSKTENRIEGLEVGADDYMSKPFEPRELILRIRRILSRNVNSIDKPPKLTFGPFLFNPDTGMLTKLGDRIHITTAEQQLLTKFGKHSNTVLSREDIGIALDGRMEGRSIDVAVARLRRKIEPDPKHPVYLQTVRNHGWMLRTDDASFER
jgi:two-component system phosphate regulon response regulator OmpR